MTDMLTRRGTLRATGATLAVGALAGCSSDGDDDSTPLPDFGLAELVFCSAQPRGYGQYERQPDATYEQGETVWIYLDVVGFEVEDAGEGQMAVDLAEDLVVRGPDGSEVLQNDFTFDTAFESDLRSQFFVVNNVRLQSGSPSGEYEVEVFLEDELGGGSITRTETFTVE